MNKDTDPYCYSDVDVVSTDSEILSNLKNSPFKLPWAVLGQFPFQAPFIPVFFQR